MSFDQFTPIGEHFGSQRWMHISKPVWIVFYEKEDSRDSFYEAYRATAPVKKGYFPWTANNERISGGSRFRTLAEATEAAA